MTATVRDHNDVAHEIDIPEGWYEVQDWHAPPMLGDRFLDINELTFSSRVIWRSHNPKCTTPTRLFGCLIRRVPGPEVYQAANI